MGFLDKIFGKKENDNKHVKKTNIPKKQKNTTQKANKPSTNNYAAMFRAQMEISGGHPSENDSLNSLVKEWEEDFPDDKNLLLQKQY